MTEIRSGIRHSLAAPGVYDFFQTLVGAYAWRRRAIDSFVSRQIPDDGLVIDIGCGTAEVLNYLPAGVEYIGFDQNRDYIAKARTAHARRNATFRCEELSPGFNPGGRRADLILAFGIVHHLDDAMSAALFRLARGMLGPNGFLLTLDPLYMDGQSSIARYIVSRDRGTEVRTEDAYKALASREFSSVESHVDRNPLYIPYTGIVMKCRA